METYHERVAELARIGVDLMHPEGYNIGLNLTKAIAAIIVMMWNFFINRYWTYNDVDKTVAA